ncbi:hypothetical protein CHS0354_042917 [Potamilus streckersoni]|uniref:Uncharacterized protein n=1 Tax=Potamilus streckersoni TaxID=2493646 RepID=A0AAE0T532_9BIVA|nr:hypothetical protein CHS0354_042917 [Potamilus streckersoni]
MDVVLDRETEVPRGRGGCHGFGLLCQGLFPRFGTKSGCREKCRQQQVDDEPKPSTSGESTDETIHVETETLPMSQEKNPKSKSSGQRDNGWILLTNGRKPATSLDHNNQMIPDPEPETNQEEKQVSIMLRVS